MCGHHPPLRGSHASSLPSASCEGAARYFTVAWSSLISGLEGARSFQCFLEIHQREGEALDSLKTAPQDRMGAVLLFEGLLACRSREAAFS